MVLVKAEEAIKSEIGEKLPANVHLTLVIDGRNGKLFEVNVSESFSGIIAELYDLALPKTVRQTFHWQTNRFIHDAIPFPTTIRVLDRPWLQRISGPKNAAARR